MTASNKKFGNSKDNVICDFYDHREQLTYRINFVKDLTSYGSLNLNQD